MSALGRWKSAHEDAEIPCTRVSSWTVIGAAHGSISLGGGKTAGAWRKTLFSANEQRNTRMAGKGSWNSRQCAPDFSRSPGLFLWDFGTPVRNPTQTQHFEFAIRFVRNFIGEALFVLQRTFTTVEPA